MLIFRVHTAGKVATFWPPSLPQGGQFSATLIGKSFVLEAGYDIRIVQELLGHSSVETTMVYTHVLNNGRCPVRSPLDLAPASQHGAIACGFSHSIAARQAIAVQPQPNPGPALAPTVAGPRHP